MIGIVQGKTPLVHENVHTDKYKCEICEKCFEGLAGLNNHECPHYDNSYGQKRLTIHVRKLTGKKTAQV